MIYSLMKKNTPIIGLDISEDGYINKISKNVNAKDLLPLSYQYEQKGIEKWWKERCLPSNTFVHKILQEQNLSCPEEYLVNNLGLSLTDHYWIKPIQSDLTWEKVNLFQNDFKNEIFLHHLDTENHTLSYSPNSSLQGSLEKSWNILDGERVLIKGNHGERSIEAINEVIATKLHQLQGFANYAEYHLLKVHDKQYQYGCYSKLFTSNDLELVSAHEIVSSEKQPNDLSTYEFLIQLAEKHGLQSDITRNQLEYQIMTDFILSNTDRHLNNIAFLQDDHNKIISMAPIFDTGKSLFVDQSNYHNTKELLSIKTNSFTKNETEMLKYVKNRNVVDLSKMPAASFIKEMYEKDDKISKNHIQHVCDAYERKIDLCRDFQLGKDLNKIKVNISRHEELER